MLEFVGGWGRLLSDKVTCRQHHQSDKARLQTLLSKQLADIMYIWETGAVSAHW